MARPTDKQLEDWCLPSATSEQGSCYANSAQLKDMTWGSLDRPIKTRLIRVYIDCGHAQDHWAFAAKWAGDDAETVIDNTIGQFNDKAMVFIGSMEQWFAKLGEFLHTDKITLDPDGRLHWAAFEKELEKKEEKKAAPILELQRNAATSSTQARMAATLQKKSPKKSGKSGRCVIL